MNTATDPRNQAVADAIRSARHLLIAEASYFRREIDARRHNDARSIIRAEAAQEAARDYGDILVWDLMTLDQAGLSHRGAEILGECVRKIRRAREAFALGEIYSGRTVPEIAVASELAIPDRWEGRATPSRN